MRLITLAGLWLAVLGSAAVSAASPCDRTCLKGSLDRYLDAMTRHDVSAAGLDPHFRYTENAAIVKPGEGLWASATALGKVQRRYFDPVTGQAAYFGLIEEGASSGIATARIRVVDNKVTEGEVVIGRKADGTFSEDGLIAKPPPEGATTEATPRQALVAAAQSYFDGLEHSDGSIVLAQKGCYRIENGLLLTGRPIAGAQAGADGETPRTDCATLAGFKATISGVVHRRFPLIDEEAGVVLGMGVFNRPPGAKRGDGSLYPRNLLTEFFVVEGGRIRGIYAAMHYMTPDNPDAPNWP